MTAPNEQARAQTLARAFHHDPVAQWVVPDPEARARLYRAWMGLVLAQADRLGHAHAADQHRVVHAWFPVSDDTPPAVIAPEDEQRFAHQAGPHYARFAELARIMDEHHPTRAHHYLAAIGVDPTLQRTGRATTALTPVLAQLDRHQQPAYLEATSPQSRTLYQRLGFADAGPPLTLPHGPSLYPMWRQPHQ